MTSLRYVHDFFFGSPEKIGLKKLSSEDILSIMSESSKHIDNSPYAESLGYILSKESSKEKEIKENTISNKEIIKSS